MKKKQTILRVAAIVLALALIAGIGLWIYADQYSKQNFADSMSQEERYQHNYTMTLYGRKYQYSGQNDVLILESVHKNLGGNTEITFRIYSYGNATQLSEALKMTCSDIEKDQRFTCIGTGSVTLLGGKLVNMSDMKTLYNR